MIQHVIFRLFSDLVSGNHPAWLLGVYLWATHATSLATPGVAAQLERAYQRPRGAIYTPHGSQFWAHTWTTKRVFFMLLLILVANPFIFLDYVVLTHIHEPHLWVGMRVPVMGRTWIAPADFHVQFLFGMMLPNAVLGSQPSRGFNHVQPQTSWHFQKSDRNLRRSLTTWHGKSPSSQCSASARCVMPLASRRRVFCGCFDFCPGHDGHGSVTHGSLWSLIFGTSNIIDQIILFPMTSFWQFPNPQISLAIRRWLVAFPRARCIRPCSLWSHLSTAHGSHRCKDPIWNSSASCARGYPPIFW